MDLHSTAIGAWHEDALDRWQTAVNMTPPDVYGFGAMARDVLLSHGPTRDGVCMCSRAWPCEPFKIMSGDRP